MVLKQRSSERRNKKKDANEYKKKEEEEKMFFFLLTSCNQYNFRHWGLATAKHSKYTSSPSLMLSDNVDPRRNVTIGGSANETFIVFIDVKTIFITYQKDSILDFRITQLVGIICNVFMKNQQKYNAFIKIIKQNPEI